MEPLDPKLARLVYDGMVQAVPGPEVEDRVLAGLLARLPPGGPPGGEAAGDGTAGAAAAREAASPGGDAAARASASRGTDAAARTAASRSGDAAARTAASRSADSAARTSASRASDAGRHGTPRGVEPAAPGSSILAKALVAVLAVGSVTAAVVAGIDRGAEPPKTATREPAPEGSAASTRAEQGTDAPVAPSEPKAASTQRAPALDRPPGSASPEPTAAREPAERASDRPRERTTSQPPIENGTKSSTTSTDALAAEIRQIAAADRALARGEPRRALELAREHAAAHPHGQLAIERTAIELGARCQLGERGSAESAEAFLREHADAPAAAKVRTRCEPSKKSPEP